MTFLLQILFHTITLHKYVIKSRMNPRKLQLRGDLNFLATTVSICAKTFVQENNRMKDDIVCNQMDFV